MIFEGMVRMNKVYATALEAVADISSGSRIAVGGFGLCGIPAVLIQALLEQGADELELVSNNCGVEDWGLGLLVSAKRVRRMVMSFVGGNEELGRQFLSGEVEMELNPQGTLAERLRAGGMGIAAFFTPTGVGTQVADGGLPWRYNADGTVAAASPRKETRDFDGRTFVMERGLPCDYALVRAAKGDRHGNLVFNKSARNFNPIAATAGRVTIAEVEELVEVGELAPDDVHTPGVFVHRVVALTPEQASEKRIERMTVRAGA